MTVMVCTHPDRSLYVWVGGERVGSAHAVRGTASGVPLVGLETRKGVGWWGIGWCTVRVIVWVVCVVVWCGVVRSRLYLMFPY